jgi:uncharacterized protein YqhQ
MPEPESQARPYIGGQAVLEGVMMRSPRSFSVVVRRKSGELVVRERPATDARKGVLAWPFVRGVVTLVEAVKLGSEALRFSAELYEKDLEDEEKRAGHDANGAASSTDHKPGVLSALALSVVAIATQDPEADPVAPVKADSEKTDADEPSQTPGKRAMSVLTIVLALGMFVALPQLFAALVNKLGHLSLDVRSPGFQALTGAFKLTIVVAYLMLIRRVTEIRRVFQYHGAEHKTISTYEAGETLVVGNARKKTTLHPRCGTTFLVMVALVSIFVFSAIGPLLPRLGLGGVVENVTFFLLKLPFLPVIAAVTFEIQRLFARYCTTGPLRVLLWPGFLVQKITTIEPDDEQLEVALASLRATLWREKAPAAAPAAVVDRTFADFATLSADPGYGAVA